VRKIEAPDSHHYNAASGWLELGNRTECRIELEAISPGNQSHPAVLDLKWALCAAEQKWDEAFELAQQLMQACPKDAAGWLHAAYATRRRSSGGLVAAWELLLPAADLFPEEPVIPFNLACYACQMGQLDDGRRWFKRACAVGDKRKITAMALQDQDLKPLWPELSANAKPGET